MYIYICIYCCHYATTVVVIFSVCCAHNKTNSLLLVPCCLSPTKLCIIIQTGTMSRCCFNKSVRPDGDWNVVPTHGPAIPRKCIGRRSTPSIHRRLPLTLVICWPDGVTDGCIPICIVCDCRTMRASHDSALPTLHSRTRRPSFKAKILPPLRQEITF